MKFDNDYIIESLFENKANLKLLIENSKNIKSFLNGEFFMKYLTKYDICSIIIRSIGKYKHLSAEEIVNRFDYFIGEMNKIENRK